MADVVFQSKIEEYLHEHQGNLNSFYRFVADGHPVGQAVEMSLSKPDIFRLRKGGKGMLMQEETEFDSPKILEILEWLMEDVENYPEDHPLWNLR